MTRTKFGQYTGTTVLALKRKKNDIKANFSCYTMNILLVDHFDM